MLLQGSRATVVAPDAGRCQRQHVASLAASGDELPGLGPAAAVATLGVVGTGIAFVIFYGLIGTVGPARAFLVTYIAPAFAVAYGVTLLDEEITAATERFMPYLD